MPADNRPTHRRRSRRQTAGNACRKLMPRGFFKAGVLVADGGKPCGRMLRGGADFEHAHGRGASVSLARP